MKTIVGLIVIVAMVLGTMVGCQTTPSEQGYRDLSVGPMTVSIPDDWQRPEDYEEFVEEVFTGFTEEERQIIQADVYGDKSEDAVTMLMTIDMVGSYELMDFTWRGWDIELEEMGMTAGEYSEMTQYGLVAGLTELTREVHRQLTIGGNEAWETTYTAKSEGEPVQVCVLIVFAPDDAGVLLMMVTQAKWAKFEGAWNTIRDSVRI
ncbi:MAG: hypothetical protein KAV68_07020 [Dehalococcoidales bacterium]|nr:hypothetical protein [Dehalococcoidales bacterium]